MRARAIRLLAQRLIRKLFLVSRTGGQGVELQSGPGAVLSEGAVHGRNYIGRVGVGGIEQSDGGVGFKVSNDGPKGSIHT